MKKVIIVTLQGDNIGNRLQNYALQKCIEEYGFEVYTPIYYTSEYDSLKKRFVLLVKSILGKIGVSKYRYDYFRKCRKKIYRQFNRKYISNSIKMTYKKAFRSDWSKYSLAITGSDQVWHCWTDDEYELPYFYLEFMPIEKRACYAPSFGFEEFCCDKTDKHLEGLSGFNSISIREKSGVRLIESITGKNAKLVLDPTLLLDISEWHNIAKKSDLYHGREYILIYFLGDSNKEYLKVITDVALDQNLEIIDVFDRNNMASMLTSPDEFIWLVEHASYVCTDSFHGTVFSILFERKFLSFRRRSENMEQMFNRIETLLELFGLTDRIYDGDIGGLFEDLLPQNIDECKRDSLSYLKSVLMVDHMDN